MEWRRRGSREPAGASRVGDPEGRPVALGQATCRAQNAVAFEGTRAVEVQASGRIAVSSENPGPPQTHSTPEHLLSLAHPPTSHGAHFGEENPPSGTIGKTPWCTRNTVATGKEAGWALGTADRPSSASSASSLPVNLSKATVKRFGRRKSTRTQGMTKAAELRPPDCRRRTNSDLAEWLRKAGPHRRPPRKPGGAGEELIYTEKSPQVPSATGAKRLPQRGARGDSSSDAGEAPNPFPNPLNGTTPHLERRIEAYSPEKVCRGLVNRGSPHGGGLGHQNQGDQSRDALRPSPSRSQDSGCQSHPPVRPDASGAGGLRSLTSGGPRRTSPR